MKKRQITFFFFVILLLVMNTQAFALENKFSTNIQGDMVVPEIIVVIVPGNANVVINPYRLPVEINNESLTDQIITEPISIHNLSAAAINVSVSVTGAIKSDSDMRLLTASTANLSTTAKRAFIYFEIQSTDDPDSIDWDDEYDAARHVLVRSGTRTKKNIVTLEAGDENAPSGSMCYGAFRLTGDCVVHPKNPWTENDGIEVVVAFSFAFAPLI